VARKRHFFTVLGGLNSFDFKTLVAGHNKKIIDLKINSQVMPKRSHFKVFTYLIDFYKLDLIFSQDLLQAYFMG